MNECQCVPCNDCNGQGYYWVDPSGTYIGPHRCDDMAESEHCEMCGGSGVIEECSKCEQERYDDDPQ